MESKVLGVCGGNGVILYPFRKELLGNIETRSAFHTPDDVQWSLNFRVAQDKEFVEYSRNAVKVIVGAPDCGHSSALAFSRAKKLSDPRKNDSFNLYLDNVRYYRPLLFLMENLPKMLNNFTDEQLKVMFPGYRLKKIIQSVSFWGNSQKSRVRLVLVGIREDLPISTDRLVTKTESRESEARSADELTRGLSYPQPEFGHVRESLASFVSLYYKDKRRITAGEARDLWLGEFKDGRHWPVYQGNLTNQPGIYINREGDFPLTVRKQNRQFNHLGLMLTPREMARIQGVPDKFKIWIDEEDRFTYSLNKARVTIAKSPPYEIGAWFKGIMDKIIT
jgi:site-specific DNA-cytosine methylase